MSEFSNPVFCALDTPDIDQAIALAHDLRGVVGGVKVGLEMFLAHGVEGYRKIAAAGLPMFLDLKLHDIPNTVTGAVKSLSPLNPAILTVHVAGGAEMLKAARAALDKMSAGSCLLVGVTVLTSLDDDDLHTMNISVGARQQVTSLARLALSSGLDGVVCSPHEIEGVRQTCGEKFKLVVPGIRPAGSAAQDQKRTLTPKEAHARGAAVLVIGRPITQAADPVSAAGAIVASLG